MKEYNDPKMELVEFQEIKCTSGLESAENDGVTEFGHLHW